MSKAVRFHQTGGPEVLVLEDVDPGAPGPGEALVEHAAIGLNFIDTYHRSGLYPLPLPSGIGSEAAGTVRAIGPGVTTVKVGERVAYAGGVTPGSYAERRVVPAGRLVPLPDGIDEKRAAAMMLKGMTAEYLLRRTFPVKKGDVILFHAAAGGVGLIACQWAKSLGATVIGTVGDDEKAALAKAHGCDHPIVTKQPGGVDARWGAGGDAPGNPGDFVARVKDLTAGRGCDVVYDSVGKDTFAGSLDCVRLRGMLVSFGQSSGSVPPFEPALLGKKGSLFFTRPALHHYTETREELLASAAALFDVVARGIVKVEVRQQYPLADAARAHRDLESRKTRGASVLLPGG